jgi:hypothetical protein
MNSRQTRTTITHDFIEFRVQLVMSVLPLHYRVCEEENFILVYEVG